MPLFALKANVSLILMYPCEVTGRLPVKTDFTAFTNDWYGHFSYSSRVSVP